MNLITLHRINKSILNNCITTHQQNIMNIQNNIPLRVSSVFYESTKNPNYNLVLVDDNLNQAIVVIIGITEAISIASKLNSKENILRPLTHDIFAETIKRFNKKIINVEIYDYKEYIFYSKINFKDFSVEARVSDAVAMAIRQKCPILTNKSVVAKAAYNFKQNNEIIDLTNKVKKEVYINDLNLNVLMIKLKDALVNENYELAARIRDEIEKRNKLE